MSRIREAVAVMGAMAEEMARQGLPGSALEFGRCLDEVLAEVARLEQERDEAKHQRDNFERIARERAENAHTNWQARGAAEAELAVTREREQRHTKAFERIARMFERVGVMTVSCGSLESAADIARAELVDEPAAGKPEGFPGVADQNARPVSWASDEPAATLAEPGEVEGEGHEGEPRLPIPGSASAAADEPREMCPKGDDCALNDGAVHCKHCGRNWPPDETWPRGGVSPSGKERQ